MIRTPEQDLELELRDPEYVKLYGASDAKVEIAITLANARRSAKKTQKELADAMNRSQPYIARLEGGEANPTIGVLGSLLALLGYRLVVKIAPLLPELTVPSAESEISPEVSRKEQPAIQRKQEIRYYTKQCDFLSLREAGEGGDVNNMDEDMLLKVYNRQKELGCFLDWAEWREKVEKAYFELVKRAKHMPYDRITITYAELGRDIGLFPLSEWFHLKIGWIVGACSVYEYHFNRPLLSALVVSADTNRPGNGFWGLSGIPARLRKAVKIEDTTSSQVDTERERFWLEELKRIDRYWKAKNEET